MKKSIFIVLFILQGIFILAQSRILTDSTLNESGAVELDFATTKAETIELANRDIEKGMPFILLQSGIAPKTNPKDSVFEERFGVHYLEFGCIGADFELMKEYNFVIFNFLTHKFGKKWERSIRKDAIGFKQRNK